MSQPIERFKDREVRVQAMLQQKIINGNRAAAEALVDAGQLEQVAPGEEFIRQGAYETDAFFILAGSVEMRIFGKLLPYGRGSGEVVGEFAAINPEMPRTATVSADKPCVMLKCSASALAAAAKQESEIWRLLAVDLTRKVEQRNQFICASNERPVILLLAGAGYENIADELELALSKDNDVVMWSEQSPLDPGSTEIDRLNGSASTADFAIALAHPEDLRRAKGGTSEVPPDSILFELGYFISVLGKHRTMLLIPECEGGTPPQPFKGIQPLCYERPGANAPPNVALAPILRVLRGLVADRRIRSRLAERK